jgi:hypothetical protein
LLFDFKNALSQLNSALGHDHISPTFPRGISQKASFSPCKAKKHAGKYAIPLAESFQHPIFDLFL